MSFLFKELDEMLTLSELKPLNDIILLLSAKKFDKIVGIGAGRMGYALRAFIMRLSHLGYETYFIGDTNLPRIDENTLVIVNSSSGETPTIVLYTEQAVQAGSFIVSFTCNTESTIGALSDLIFKIPSIDTKMIMKTIYEVYTFVLFDILIDELIKFDRLDMAKISQNHSILE